MTIKEIVASIKAKQPEIKTVYFVGCGASQSDLFPAKYFLENNAKKLRTSIYTANNFNYSTPAGVDDTAIVITCSLSGNTPETVAATKLAVEKGAHVVAVTHKADSAWLRMVSTRSSMASMRAMVQRWKSLQEF